MATQIWSGDQADAFINAEMSVGVGVDRVTSPAPPNGLTYWSQCNSTHPSDNSIVLKDPTTFGTSAYNRHTFAVQFSNLSNIVTTIKVIDIYINWDSGAGADNFTIQAQSGTFGSDNHRVIVLDAAGATVLAVEGPFGASPDNTTFQVDVAYKIHATTGEVAIYVGGVLKGSASSLATKVGSDATCSHYHTGHSNAAETPGGCATYYGGFKHDTDVALGANEELGWAKVTPGWHGVGAPAMENQAGTFTMPGQDLDFGVVENISDETAAYAQYAPGALAQYGGAWPCNKGGSPGPNGLFNADSIIHGAKWVFQHSMVSRSGDANDIGMTYGRLYAPNGITVSISGTTLVTATESIFAADHVGGVIEIADSGYYVITSVAGDICEVTGGDASNPSGKAFKIWQIDTVKSDGGLGTNKIHAATLFDGDTYYPDPLTDYAVGGFYCEPSSNPLNLIEMCIHYCFDWATRAQPTVHIPGLTHIEGLTAIL